MLPKSLWKIPGREELPSSIAGSESRVIVSLILHPTHVSRSTRVNQTLLREIKQRSMHCDAAVLPPYERVVKRLPVVNLTLPRK